MAIFSRRSFLYALLGGLAYLSARSGARAASAAAELVILKEKDWRQEYETFFERQFYYPSLTFPAIQGALRRLTLASRQRGGVLYLLPGEEALVTILVLPQGEPILTRRGDVSQARLMGVVEAFRRQVSDPSQATFAPDLTASQQLYDWLIGPIAPQLKAAAVDLLLLCPGAGLRSLPYAALHDGDQFLVQTLALSLIPAFSLMDSRSPLTGPLTVLAMGASEFPDHSPLPAVPVELAAVTEHLAGKYYLNEDFTLQRLRQERLATPYTVVHLATHAEFDPGAVGNSYIQLWEGRLALGDLGQLNLDLPTVELLVLSACKTALGDPSAELGFAGLAMQAGVKTALGSLWYVSDAGTLVLMDQFYQYLGSSPSKAQALRRAQVAMIEQRLQEDRQRLVYLAQNQAPALLTRLPAATLAHPYYWAAFTLIGSPW